MDREKIFNYISDSDEISVPELQNKFGLGYKEIRGFVQSLCDNGKLVLCDDGFHFKKTDKSSEKFDEGDFLKLDFDSLEELNAKAKAIIKDIQNTLKKLDLPSFYQGVLKEIIEKHVITISSIQRKFSVGFVSASKAVEFFERQGLIKPARRGYVINEFLDLYDGDKDDEEEEDEEEDYDEDDDDDDDNDFDFDDGENKKSDDSAAERLKKFNTAMLERVCYDEIEIIVKANEKITKDELVETLKKNLENKAYNMIDFKPLIEKINNLSEEEFDEIKVIILS